MLRSLPCSFRGSGVGWALRQQWRWRQGWLAADAAQPAPLLPEAAVGLQKHPALGEGSATRRSTFVAESTAHQRQSLAVHNKGSKACRLF